jgi:nucleotide-binding universal stress UspA family protein
MEKKILGPLDGSQLSERALEQAEIIAKALPAEVILTQVIENPLAAAPEAGPAVEKKVAGETLDRAQGCLEKVFVEYAAHYRDAKDNGN